MNEMRKLIETLEQINEDPTVGAQMHELQSKLTELSSFAKNLYWMYKKYPQLKQHQELVQKVGVACDQFRKEAFDLR